MFEGFRPNGLHIRIQRILLRLVACVKIDVDDFLKTGKFRYLKPLKLILSGLSRLWEYQKTISHGPKLLGAYIKAYFGRKVNYF